MKRPLKSQTEIVWCTSDDVYFSIRLLSTRSPKLLPIKKLFIVVTFSIDFDFFSLTQEAIWKRATHVTLSIQETTTLCWFNISRSIWEMKTFLKDLKSLILIRPATFIDFVLLQQKFRPFYKKIDYEDFYHC